MAAKELELLFLDFRNVYRMKLPDINNTNNIDWLISLKNIALEKYCTRLRLVQYFSSSCNIVLYHNQCQSILHKYYKCVDNKN